jgi:hypothetical protein
MPGRQINPLSGGYTEKRIHAIAGNLERAFFDGSVEGVLTQIRSVIALYPPSSLLKKNIWYDVQRMSREVYPKYEGSDWCSEAIRAERDKTTRDARGRLLTVAAGYLLSEHAFGIDDAGDDEVLVIVTDHRGKWIQMTCYRRTVPLNATLMGVDWIIGVGVEPADDKLAAGGHAMYRMSRADNIAKHNIDQCYSWRYEIGRHANNA